LFQLIVAFDGRVSEVWGVYGLEVAEIFEESGKLDYYVE
jgi:hypothetical protein